MSSLGKPGDFFVGIIDLFAVFLPGGLLSFVLFQEYMSTIELTQAQSWIIFLFSSYLLGHLIFMVGANIDSLYNIHRDLRNPYTNESAFQCASKIKKDMLNAQEAEAINTYQWSTAILTTQFPAAMVDIDRLVADSKFFRSLVVVTPVVSMIYIFEDKVLLGLLMLVLVLPCYFRYYDRRLKSTTRAYQYIVSLNALGKLGKC